MNILSEVSKPVDMHQPLSSPSGENMEQLGLIASSIAHDFNNLLTGIMGHMSLALLKTSSDDAARSHIESAVKTAEYAAALTAQLLNYSRKQNQNQVVECVNLNEIVDDVVVLMGAVLISGLDIELNLSKSLPQIEVSRTHLQQIVMNLIINAAEAIDDPVNGKIVIYTGRCRASSWKRSCGFNEFQEMPLGDYVFLQINDNGKGMDENTLDKIFDPFFSTKPKGRGLGLSTIKDIVREYNGQIAVKSVPDVGTTFRVCFPYHFDSFSPVH